MENIAGVVERITYQNEETGYGVIKVRVKGFSELITLTGKFISINVGTMIEAKGNFTINKKFGRQFSVQEYKESLPASINGIEKYLGSGLIEGIGPKFAKQIVKEFGENTINIIENNPMKLLDIPNIGIRSEEHTSELQSQSVISYAVFCLKKIFFNDTATTEIYTICYTLSLHDALPICYIK